MIQSKHPMKSPESIHIPSAETEPTHKYGQIESTLVEYIPVPKNQHPEYSQYKGQDKDMNRYREAIQENADYGRKVRDIHDAITHIEKGELVARYQQEALTPLIDQHEIATAERYQETIGKLIKFAPNLIKGYGRIGPFSMPAHNYAFRNHEQLGLSFDRCKQEALITVIESDRQLDITETRIAELEARLSDLSPLQFKEARRITDELTKLQQLAIRHRTEIFKIIPQQYSLDTRTMSKSDHDTFLHDEEQRPTIEQKYRTPLHRNLTDYIQSQAAKTHESYTSRDGKTSIFENNYRISQSSADEAMGLINEAKAQSSALDTLHDIRSKNRTKYDPLPQ